MLGLPALTEADRFPALLRPQPFRNRCERIHLAYKPAREYTISFTTPAASRPSNTGSNSLGAPASK